MKRMSVLHQNSGGIGKYIPPALEISLDPRDFSRLSGMDFPIPPFSCRCKVGRQSFAVIEQFGDACIAEDTLVFFLFFIADKKYTDNILLKTKGLRRRKEGLASKYLSTESGGTWKLSSGVLSSIACNTFSKLPFLLRLGAD